MQSEYRSIVMLEQEDNYGKQKAKYYYAELMNIPENQI